MPRRHGRRGMGGEPIKGAEYLIRANVIPMKSQRDLKETDRGIQVLPCFTGPPHRHLTPRVCRVLDAKIGLYQTSENSLVIEEITSDGR